MVRKALAALGLLVAGVVAAEEIPVVRFSVGGFQVEGENPLSPAETDALLAPYVGDYEGLDGLLSAADELEQALAERGYSFHRVTLPPQTLDQGIVTLQIVVFKVGTVAVEGNTTFSERNILASVPSLKAGETPNTRRLSRDLYVANRHPAKTISINMRESEIPDSIDATVKVNDGKPWQVFGVFNNTGTEESGMLRLALGAQHSNLWDRDHQFTFTYATSPDNAANVHQYGFNYSLPLYSVGSTLSFFLINSDVDTGEVASFFDVSGSGRFIGATWTRAMLRRGNLNHQWSVNFQDRDFTNEVFLTGVAGAASLVPDVRSRPVTVQYDGDYRTERLNAAFYAGVAKNLAGGANNNDFIYNLSRSGAKTDWAAIRFGSAANYFLPKDFLLRWLVDGQVANEPLIPGEQFGVGGMNSVRGYTERATTGDSGFRSGVEIWTPPLGEFYNVRFLTFFDYGYRDLSEPEPGIEKTDTIASVGFGARWQWKDQIAASVDYGIPLMDVAPGGGEERPWYFNLFVRY